MGALSNCGGLIAQVRSEELLVSRQRVPGFFQREGLTSGGVEQARFVTFAFSLVLQYLGVPKSPNTRKKRHEQCHRLTPFCVLQMLVKLGLRAVSPHAGRQSTGKSETLLWQTPCSKFSAVGTNYGG